jgi:hypothetical protein
MGSDSPSLRLRRVLVVEALPDADGTGPERLGVNRTSRRRPCPIRAQYDDEPSQSEPTAANVPSHARETPLVTGPPGHVFQAGHPPDAAGSVDKSIARNRPRGRSRLGFRLSCLRSPPFADPSGVTLSCGQAGNTPERPGSRVGKRVGLTATVTATWLRRDRSAVNLPVQLAPSTDCHGLWDRPGPDLRIGRSVCVKKARSGDCAEFGTKC